MELELAFLLTVFYGLNLYLTAENDSFINRYLEPTFTKTSIMPEYDINDPTDLDIMRSQFDIISRDDWEEYIELASERNIGYKNVNILKSASRKAGISKYLSPKVIKWALSVVEQLDEELDEEEE